MKRGPSSKESGRITRADIQPAEGKRLKCPTARSIDSFEGRKRQVVTGLAGELHCSLGEGARPSKGIGNRLDFPAKRRFPRTVSIPLTPGAVRYHQDWPARGGHGYATR